MAFVEPRGVNRGRREVLKAFFVKACLNRFLFRRREGADRPRTSLGWRSRCCPPLPAIVGRKRNAQCIASGPDADEVTIETELDDDGIHLSQGELGSAFEPAADKAIGVLGDADLQGSGAAVVGERGSVAAGPTEDALNAADFVLDAAQRPAQPSRRDHLVSLFFAQDIAHVEGGYPPVAVNVLAQFRWPVLRRPSLAGFG